MKENKKKKTGKVGFNYPEKGEFLYQIRDMNDLDAEKMLLMAIRIDMHIVKEAIIDIQKHLFG